VYLVLISKVGRRGLPPRGEIFNREGDRHIISKIEKHKVINRDKE